MNDDLDEDYTCDPGYCQLAEVAKQARESAATIARLEGERDSASGLALTLQAECERLHGDVAAAEAQVAALVGSMEKIANSLSCTNAMGRGYADRIIAAIAAAKEDA